MSFKRIKFIDPVESLSGKRNKDSKTCFFQGALYGQRGWGTGERNYVKNPLTPDEKQHRTDFGTIAKNVSARMKQTSPTFEQDMAAFMAQRDTAGGYERFRPFLWHDEQSKLA